MADAYPGEESNETKARIRAVGGLTLADKRRGAAPVKVVEEPPAQEDEPQPEEPDALQASGVPWILEPANLKVVAYFAIIATALAVYYVQHILPAQEAKTGVSKANTVASCRDDFNYGFHVNSVVWQVKELAEHSWEYGTAVEAMLELRHPELTVFSPDAFANGKIAKESWNPLTQVESLNWARDTIRTDADTLYEDDWGVSDPASLGVPALIIGQSSKSYLKAATRQKEYLLKTAPRYSNGAISHRQNESELWNDAIGMFPPFLAYYAVYDNDLDLMRETVRQISLYREVLMEGGVTAGLWQHIVGPSDKADDGIWSTGVAWAAFGMARVRATISAWSVSNEAMGKEIAQLDHWIWEILDGVMRTDNDESGLLRNYLGDDSWDGETSGTALLAATMYRMAVLNPTKFDKTEYLQWAYEKRQAVSRRVMDDGIARPAQQPLDHKLRKPLLTGSPEGESFVLMMGAAWRDYQCPKLVKEQTNAVETEQVPSGKDEL